MQWRFADKKKTNFGRQKNYEIDTNLADLLQFGICHIINM